MIRRILTAKTIVLPLLVLSVASLAMAGVHQIWDEAHFFKTETLDEVDKLLADIHTRFGKDLMVETFASIPEDLKQREQTDGNDKFFENWSMSEGRQLELNGVLVLITGEPHYVKVQVGLATRQSLFTLADASELADKLRSAFRAKQFDSGILEGVQFVRDRMARNLDEARTTKPTTQPVQVNK